MNRTGLPRPANVLAISALALATAACADPRVGEIVSYPDSGTMTVQARVVSYSPLVAQVAVPRQVCYDELRQESAPSSGAGAIMGAIAGGAMGNAVGKGSGRAVTTGLGVLLGAAMGDRIESDGRPGVTRSVQHCQQQSTYQNQVVGYKVVYEYGGQRYSTQMQREPGPTIPVTVAVNLADQGSYNGYNQQTYSYCPPPQPVVVIPAMTRYVVPPPPVTQVIYSPGVVVRGWDRGDRWGERHHDHDERGEERDDRREHRDHRDDGRATFVSRWN